MTDHNDPIVRALERLTGNSAGNNDLYLRALPILTDLAAEIEQRTAETLRPLVATADNHAARLAAVMEGIDREADPPLRNMTQGCRDRLQALAHGEGG